jgi:hypothetical protein
VLNVHCVFTDGQSGEFSIDPAAEPGNLAAKRPGQLPAYVADIRRITLVKNR